MFPALLTRHKAAKALKVSVPTMDRLIARGEVKALRVGGRLVRIPIEAIDAYLRKQAAKGV